MPPYSYKHCDSLVFMFTAHNSSLSFSLLCCDNLALFFFELFYFFYCFCFSFLCQNSFLSEKNNHQYATGDHIATPNTYLSMHKRHTIALRNIAIYPNIYKKTYYANSQKTQTQTRKTFSSFFFSRFFLFFFFYFIFLLNF